MKVIYVSNALSTNSNTEFQKLTNAEGVWQQQKFNRLLIDGFCENECEVVCISAPAINRHNCKKKFVDFKTDSEGNTRYLYLPVINFTFIKTLFYRFKLRSFLKRELYGQKECFVICDALKDSISYCAYKKAKRYGIKTVALYTDVPGFEHNSHGGIIYRINRFLSKRHFSQYDGYIFLTKQMNDVVNLKAKPYMIMECVCDSKMTGKVKTATENKKTIMYAGTLDKAYGIGMLIDAFLKIDASHNDVELRIFGLGDYADNIKEIAQKCSEVKYFGSVDNDRIVDEETRAFLIVNPRSSAGEYTKYSFPSKNMEAMASGTPLLGVKLPGIPEEYFDYFYTVDEESAEGFMAKIEEILSYSPEVVESFGIKAREYVLKNKNNIVQTKRIIEFAKRMNN